MACIDDDILVYGVGDTLEEATLDHDQKRKIILLQSITTVDFGNWTGYVPLILGL